VTLVLASLLAAQATPAAGEVTRLHCRAIAVNGARLDFPFELRGSEGTGEARVPGRNAPFVRAADRRFVIRGLPNALVFRLRTSLGTSVDVSLEQEGMTGFPVAVGYCGAQAWPRSRTASVGFGELHEAALVAAADGRAPCAMLTKSGAVSRFRTHLEGGDRLFEPLDAIVWAGPKRSREMGAPRIPAQGAIPIMVSAIFSDEAGSNPTGLTIGYIDEARSLAVGTYNFNDLGVNQSGSSHAYAICAVRLGRRG